ncbi:hypothetical protein Sjap_015285 [Stephania japonica]|uniref:Transposase-associated domain-containing protein n=1 Tax=Stephania japonica TaxID=461633 RepID=A0AAP0IIZ0_9MAGN
MVPDKQWIKLVDTDRFSETYEDGVEQFLDYAFKMTGEIDMIRCPCVRCNNTDYGSREIVRSHLKVNGIMKNYTFWYHHGERRCESDSESEELEEESDNEVEEMIQDFESESEELEVVGDDGVREMIEDLYHGRTGNEFEDDSSNYKVDGEEPNEQKH